MLSPQHVAKEMRRLQRELEEITEAIEVHEARLKSIDASFCEDGFYERTPPDQVALLEQKRAETDNVLKADLQRWGDIESQLEGLSSLV